MTLIQALTPVLSFHGGKESLAITFFNKNMEHESWKELYSD